MGAISMKKTKPSNKRVYVPTSALATSIGFDEDMMQVSLSDCWIINVPLIWFPLLHTANSEQRMHYEIGGGGIGLHWEELDEDLSVANLMAGVDWRSA
jgi:hypothetical protein